MTEVHGQGALPGTAGAGGGAPGVRLHGALAEWFEERRLRALLSLSDEGDYAVAMCVVERMAP